MHLVRYFFEVGILQFYLWGYNNLFVPRSLADLTTGTLLIRCITGWQAPMKFKSNAISCHTLTSHLSASWVRLSP